MSSTRFQLSFSPETVSVGATRAARNALPEPWRPERDALALAVAPLEPATLASCRSRLVSFTPARWRARRAERQRLGCLGFARMQRFTPLARATRLRSAWRLRAAVALRAGGSRRAPVAAPWVERACFAGVAVAVAVALIAWTRRHANTMNMAVGVGRRHGRRARAFVIIINLISFGAWASCAVPLAVRPRLMTRAPLRGVASAESGANPGRSRSKRPHPVFRAGASGL